MKLSIIIPVYNAENDIGRCVESIKTINEICLVEINYCFLMLMTTYFQMPVIY